MKLEELKNDEAYETYEVLKLSKVQTMHDVFASFEDMCGLIIMGWVLYPLVLKRVVDQTDALDMASACIN